MSMQVPEWIWTSDVVMGWCDSAGCEIFGHKANNCKVANAFAAHLAAKDKQIAELSAAMENLHKVISEKASRAYCDMMEQSKRPECRGWEAKVQAGCFGKPQFEGHQKADQLYGKHLAFHEALTAMSGATAPASAFRLVEAEKGRTSDDSHPIRAGKLGT